MSAERAASSAERALRGGEVSCGALALVEHTGERLAFSPPARVIEPFRERLRELERVVIEVSARVYARAERHLGERLLRLSRSER